MQSIFTIDVEDWFHILDVPVPYLSQSHWGTLPSRVEVGFRRLLDLLAEKNARATCFFLASTARRFPHLGKEAVEMGHEVASHGTWHRLVYELDRPTFLEDIRDARHLLQDLSGQSVGGHRAPGFSVTEDTPWFYDAVVEAGYTYDSSIFPGPRNHGGLRTHHRAPYSMQVEHGTLVEFPITVADVLVRPVCFFGGGYLRLFPWPVIRTMAHRVLGEGRPVIFYVHPREVDLYHPQVPMKITRTFKSYVNLDTTEGKIRQILEEFPVCTFTEFLAGHPVAAVA